MEQVQAKDWQLGELGDRLFRIGLGIGAVGLGVSLVLGLSGVEGFYRAYLVNFCFFLSLTLGGLFFVIIQHLTGATWSVVVRRIAEGVAANAVLMLILVIPVLLGVKELYAWADPAIVAQDALLQAKRAYLNLPFFCIRLAIYFAVWIGFSQYFARQSRLQDETGDLSITLRMERTSAPAVLLFALTTTFAAFDLLMSLEPHWFSTIFGVYFFAGSMFGFFALLPLIVLFFQRSGRMQHVVTAEHLHDLGKWMFAFTVFWAYIGFSQYFLIWYANLPEETIWYARRQNGGWTSVSVLLLFGHFLVPFFGLLPRWVKKFPATLAFWSCWMLVMHWVDLFWIGTPGGSPDRVPFGIFHVLCFVGMAGLFVAGVAFNLKGASLVPARDPRLAESLAFENV